MTMTRRTALLAIALATGLSRVAAAQVELRVVPPLRAEVIPVHPPGPRMVWEPGHWNFERGEYVWIPGRYIPAHRFHRFAHGHWVMRGGVQVWEPGHWE